MANDDLRYDSRVFAVVRWIDDKLTGATWPPHPATGDVPDVGVGDSNLEGVEHIDVIFRIDDDATITWARVSPGGRDEKFAVTVSIRSLHPGLDRAEIWDRLEALAVVVQRIFYDPESRTFKAPGERPWSIQLDGVDRVTPNTWRTPEGWVGDCEVVVAVQTRI